VFIGITLFVSIGYLLYRWNDLRSENQLQSWLSREALFLVNNLLFLGIFIIVFWGTNFPLISELFTGQKVTVGPPFYERATGPLWLLLLLLMGIAPLSAWSLSTLRTLGRAAWKPAIAAFLILVAVFITGVHNPAALLAFALVAFVACVTLYEYGRAVVARSHSLNENLLASFWHLAGKNRRRYGGYIIHLGVVLMALGVIGIEMFQTETQGALTPGQSLTLGQYSVTYDSLAQFDVADGRNVARAVMSITKNGQSIGEVYPRRDFFYDSQQPMTIPGVRSTMEDDLYVVLVDWQPISTQMATFKVFHNPLVNWLWLGGLVFIVGAMVAAWPGKEAENFISRGG
jgi:cytochrome c-type biogenesis protein CcmF